MNIRKKQNNLPIGVFDSGIGGLTVVKELIKILPNEEIIYFGDTARVPYGTKSKKTIEHYALQDCAFLMSKKVKLIIAACNTVSSNAMPALKKKFNIPIMDVLNPNALFASKITENNRIGIIGTPATIESKMYEKVIKKHNGKAKIYTLKTPLLVPLAEEGWINKEATRLIVREYMDILLKKNIDTLILGCTHYPLFEKMIKEICTDRVNVINSADKTAEAVLFLLEKNKMLNESKSKGKLNFYLSDIPRNFPKILKRFINREISRSIYRINIEKF